MFELFGLEFVSFIFCTTRRCFINFSSLLIIHRRSGFCQRRNRRSRTMGVHRWAFCGSHRNEHALTHTHTHIQTHPITSIDGTACTRHSRVMLRLPFARLPPPAARRRIRRSGSGIVGGCVHIGIIILFEIRGEITSHAASSCSRTWKSICAARRRFCSNQRRRCRRRRRLRPDKINKVHSYIWLFVVRAWEQLFIPWLRQFQNWQSYRISISVCMCACLRMCVCVCSCECVSVIFSNVVRQLRNWRNTILSRSSAHEHHQRYPYCMPSFVSHIEHQTNKSSYVQVLWIGCNCSGWWRWWHLCRWVAG